VKVGEVGVMSFVHDSSQLKFEYPLSTHAVDSWTYGLTWYGPTYIVASNDLPTS
jgi:hypothetical protein